ncbi:MAG: L,D-transpeptidase family protein [Cellulosilyticaceae bacterium]
MKANKKLYGIALTIVLMAVLLFFLRDFNVVLSEVVDSSAEVTINFLVPMDKDKIKDCIMVKSNKVYNNQFISKVEWISESTCKISLEETGDIRGEAVTLIIKDAPTKYKNISKNVTLPIQFLAEVDITEPTESIMVTTTEPFYVRFNTPMDARMLNKYLQSDAKFFIEPEVILDENGEEVLDETSFLFTPKTPLENDHNYLLSFRKGMPSRAGDLLENALQVTIHTDVKPNVDTITPTDGSKWVGLYPKITVESDRAIQSATLTLAGHKIEGQIKDEQTIDFYPKEMLASGKTYTGSVQLKAVSGEESDIEEFSFTTVPMTKDRIWVTIEYGKPNVVIVYEGTKEIKRLVCSAGDGTISSPAGTYYINQKSSNYFDEVNNEGSNYLMQLSDDVLMHGITRDDSWKVKEEVYNKIGKPQKRNEIILKEEDAKWLYETLPENTMIIIH